MIRIHPRLAETGRSAAFLLALALSGALGACYTAIRHPAAGEPVAARSDETCYRCHSAGATADPDLYPWGEYYGRSTSPWINYYASPWWYESRWERNPPSSGGHGEAGAATLSERQGWGRRPRSAAGSDSLRTRGSVLPPAPIVSTPPIAPMPGGTPAGQTPGNPQGTGEKEKKEKKLERRALRR
jgi:hypothetical protein